LKWKLENFLTSYQIPGDKIPIIKGSALKAIEGDAELGVKPIRRVNEGC
jgi:elongation factor Tu